MTYEGQDPSSSDESTTDVTAGARRRFLRGESDREETARLVRTAILSLGDADAEPADPPPAWEPPETDAADYAAALDAVAKRVGELSATVVAEEAAAEVLVAELTAAADGETLAARDPRFHTWAVGDALRRATQGALATDPARGVEIADLAVAAAGGALEAAEARAADAAAGEVRHAADLAALAWGQRANARRVASDLRGADADLNRAFALARAGTRDRLVLARLESWGASLRIYQSRFPEAATLVRRAAGRYLALGDKHAFGRTLLKEARVQAMRDDLDAACGTLLEALDHLDPQAEPRLAAVAHNNFASYLEKLGQPAQAARQLEAVEELLDRLEVRGEGQRLDRARLDWMRGRVAVTAGDATAGEELLGRARQAFVDHGVAFEASQVALELALIYAESGRVADQRRLAEEMLPIFTSRDLHADARAALALYIQAAREQAVQSGLVRDLSDYLDRSRVSPGLVFRHH